MRYRVLACDYDGTLVPDGRLDAPTMAALRDVRASGRRVVLVTGRELPDLLRLVSEPELFDRIVAENGALLYRPDSREERVLGDAPPGEFVSELVRRGIGPLSVGRAIVATSRPNEQAVRDVIRDLGVDRQVILNKDAVMILPAGVDKATGLDAALAELDLSARQCVAVGDAENDEVFLCHAGRAVAVANALPELKMIADLVTDGEYGSGVRELVSRLIASDMAGVAQRRRRQAMRLKARDNGHLAGPR